MCQHCSFLSGRDHYNGPGRQPALVVHACGFVVRDLVRRDRLRDHNADGGIRVSVVFKLRQGGLSGCSLKMQAGQ
ncbi:hypothetical protein M514_25623, partial [Trichuris suis]